MKKKLFTVALALIIAVTAITGSSLAYLRDTDAQDNVFTVGDVKIDLYENFVNESKLLPAVRDTDENGETVWNNAVEKEVFVYNEGTEAAYVRVHIAIPAILDNGDPSFDASKNVLHFNYDSENVGAGKWDWSKTAGEAYEGDWNFYTTTINGVDYNVYVVTYEAELAPETSTVSAMNQVYLDPKVTNEDITRINEALKGKWSIYVIAEGVQTAGFDNAYEALNAAFGVPGEYEIDWDKAAEGVDTKAGE